MTDSEKQSKSRFRITEGILLALASALSYFLVFYYEKGYAQYFDIPVSFIQVSFIDVIVFASIVLGAIWLFTVFMNPFVIAIQTVKVHPVIRAALLRLLPLIVFFVIVFFLFGYSNRKYWGGALAVVIFIALLEFVMPLLSRRNVSGYVNKLVAQEEFDQEFDESHPDIFGLIKRHYGWRLLLIILGVFLSTVLAEQAGLARAVNQSKFLVLDTSPEMVVLRVYGDRMIAAPFNRKTQEVESKFVIKVLGEDNNLVISPEDVGSLKLKPTPTPTPTFTPSPTATPVPTNTPVP